MEGKVLFQAAKIVHLAWKQTEAMIECLNSKLEKSLAGIGFTTKQTDHYEEDSAESLATRYLSNIGLRGKHKKKPEYHLAFQVYIFDEEAEGSLCGWEPSIYVFFNPGSEPFEDQDIRISAFLEQGRRLDTNDSKLWRWDEISENDSWFFAVPLVKINNEEDLQEQIVYPVINLIKGQMSAKVFPSNSIAYRYTIEGDSISLDAPDK